MDNSSQSAGSSISKRHGRNVSINRTPVTRRLTKGPLEGEDDPPASEHSIPTTTTTTTTTVADPLAADAANAPIPSTPFSPQQSYSITSPAASNNLPIRSQEPTTSSDLDELDLSSLLRPSVYHLLPPPLNLPSHPPLITPPNTSLEILLHTHNYRGACLFCADRLSNPPPTTSGGPPSLSNSDILILFHIRLATLILLGHTNLAAEESRVLEDIISEIHHRHLSSRSDAGTKVNLPWELRLLLARLASTAHNDVRRGIAAFYELAREARQAAAVAKKVGDGSSREMWKTRLRECGINVANVLIEAGDLEGAAWCLESFRTQREQAGQGGEEYDEKNESLQTRLAMVYLSLGDVEAAKRCCSNLRSASRGSNNIDQHDSDNDSSTTLLSSLLQIAQGDYATASHTLRTLLPQTDLTLQNLAICLFYQGSKDETITLLESLVRDNGRSFYALTFNLATCFELSCADARGRKVELAEEVVGRMRARGRGGKEQGERGATAFKL